MEKISAEKHIFSSDVICHIHLWRDKVWRANGWFITGGTCDLPCALRRQEIDVRTCY